LATFEAHRDGLLTEIGFKSKRTRNCESENDQLSLNFQTNSVLMWISGGFPVAF
jgi:hypothetical protein